EDGSRRVRGRIEHKQARPRRHETLERVNVIAPAPRSVQGNSDRHAPCKSHLSPIVREARIRNQHLIARIEQSLEGGSKSVKPARTHDDLASRVNTDKSVLALELPYKNRPQRKLAAPICVMRLTTPRRGESRFADIARRRERRVTRSKTD